MNHDETRNLVRLAFTTSTGADAVADRVFVRLRSRTASAPAPGRRAPMSRPVLLAVVAAVTACVLSAAAVFAVSGNFPVQLTLLQPPPRTGPPPEKAVQAPLPPAKAKTPDTPTTVAAAQTAFGHPVLTAAGVPGAQLNAAYFDPAMPVPPDSKSGTTSRPAEVRLAYAYQGTTAELDETFDPSSAPLTVAALDGPAGPTIKGGAMPKIETIDGSQYLFGYSGSQVVVAMWKSASGVTVTARFTHPIDHAAAVALVTHLQ